MRFEAEEELTDEQVRPGLNYIIKDGAASQVMGVLTGGAFLIAFAFLIGLYALHRLAMVREEGEVEEKIVAHELFTEVRTQVRTLSSVEGVRQMVSFPISMVRSITERMMPNGGKKKKE